MTAVLPDLDRLLTVVDEHLVDSVTWPGRRAAQAELAVVDAVLSIRTHAAEGPDPDITGAVGRYRAARSGRRCDDLAVLATLHPADLHAVLDDEHGTCSTAKAAAIIAAARALTKAGVRAAADLRADDPDQRTAWCSVHGLGRVTWSYLGMLLEEPATHPGSWLVRFVERALERPVSTDETAALSAATDRFAEPADDDASRWSQIREAC